MDAEPSAAGRVADGKIVVQRHLAAGKPSSGARALRGPRALRGRIQRIQAHTHVSDKDSPQVGSHSKPVSAVDGSGSRICTSMCFV